METTFPRALAAVLRHEGGYVDDPRDPGGATNQGITLTTFRHYYGEHQMRRDLAAITQEQVTHIYRTGYWDCCRCNELPVGVDYVVFDQAVNSSPLQSITWLQKAAGVATDGQLGPVTLGVVSNAVPSILIQEMCRLRLSVLQRLRNGTLWRTYGRGWRRRVTEVQALALQLAAGHVSPHR